MMYVQCRIQKANQIDVSWMEEKFAVVGRKVRRKTEQEDTWSDGWVITETYGKVSENHVKKMRDLHKEHRKGTDV